MHLPLWRASAFKGASPLRQRALGCTRICSLVAHAHKEGVARLEEQLFVPLSIVHRERVRLHPPALRMYLRRTARPRELSSHTGAQLETCSSYDRGMFAGSSPSL